MNSFTFFIIFIPILACVLLAVNLLFATHNPYQEKDSPFECGFHSFLGQNRTQFSISFFIFALLFLLFDLEIVILFILLLTFGFIFELGKKALTIESRQFVNPNVSTQIETNLVSGLNLLTFATIIGVSFVYTDSDIYMKI